MIARPVTVILVDDTEGKLTTLKTQLEDSQSPHFVVHAFSHPYQAMQYLLDHPGVVEFVFVDHMLVSDRPPDCPSEVPLLGNGIDLARAISQRWPQIGVIIYSGDETITEQDQWAGLAAGAHRYVYIKPPQNLLDVVTKEIISEIRELREIQETLERFHEMRGKTDILQRSVRVGIDLIDRRFKVWYRNDEFKDITGQSTSSHRFCCAFFHGHDWPPCRGCQVAQVLPYSESQWKKKREEGGVNRIFYSPVFPGEKPKHKYMHVWAEPVYAPDHTEIPIAVVESVIDLTDSPTIEQMSIEENLDILLQAITELTCEWLEPKQVPILQDGRWGDAQQWDKRPGYTRVRVYRADFEGPRPIVRLLRRRGEHPGLPDNFTLPLLKTPDRSTSESGCGIGLADVKTVVQSHGASIRETGKCGTGVRFEITFPL